ncbi:unnamed protein product [Mesocestoides corti]|uniref:Uncharacterized protein n=1 Tax=Mesocestoides corti TaxID=53468 RepID=A0A0R3UEL7_MESCO|nr:unnamed protein product [Mesocestoides corti]
MVFRLGKKEKLQTDKGAGIKVPKPKRFKRIRRAFHARADLILVLLYSVFPTIISLTLIIQEFKITDCTAKFSGFVGYMTGAGGILVQLVLILCTVAPTSVGSQMDGLLICTAALQTTGCIVGASMVLFQTGKQHIFLASLSLVNVVFCVMPIFLGVASFTARRKAVLAEEDTDDDNVSYFASINASTPTIIKKGFSEKKDVEEDFERKSVF